MDRWKLSVAAAILLVCGAGAGMAWAKDGEADRTSDVASVVASGRSRLLGGSGPSGTKFVAVDPCRLVDTRVGSNAPMSPNQTRRFKVRGTGSKFAAQGGKANGCGIPATGVASMEVTITAVDADKAGFLRVFPKAEPTATFMNYTPTFNASNTGTVKICTDCGDDDIGVKDLAGTTDLVVDIQGYYEFVMVAVVDFDGTLVRSSRVSSVSKTGTGGYLVTFDRDVTGCAYLGSSASPDDAVNVGQVAIARKSLSPNTLNVQTTSSAGSSADSKFQVEVVC